MFDEDEAERKLIAEGGAVEIFLMLYNHHNGYYGHGFEPSPEASGAIIRATIPAEAAQWIQIFCTGST